MSQYRGIKEVLYSESTSSVKITLKDGAVHTCEIQDIEAMRKGLDSGEAYQYLYQYEGDTPEQIEEIVSKATDWKPFE